MSSRKLVVQVFYVKGNPVAQHINPQNGKSSYFDARLIIKKVAPKTHSFYKVVVKDGVCTKVLAQINKPHLRRQDISKILEEIIKTI